MGKGLISSWSALLGVAGALWFGLGCSGEPSTPSGGAASRGSGIEVRSISQHLFTDTECTGRYITAWQQASASRVVGSLEFPFRCPQQPTEPLVFAGIRALDINGSYWQALGATSIYDVSDSGFSINLATDVPLADIQTEGWYTFFTTTGVNENTAHRCTGQTTPGGWRSDEAGRADTIYVDVDLSHCSATWQEPPVHITSLVSPAGGHEGAIGASSIFERPDGERGFRVYLTQPGLTVQEAVNDGWKLNWQALPDRQNLVEDRSVGCTSRDTRWIDRPEDGHIAGIVDLSHCSVENNSLYFASLSGTEGHNLVRSGVNSVYATRRDMVRVSIYQPGLTADIARARGYRLNVLARGPVYPPTAEFDYEPLSTTAESEGNYRVAVDACDSQVAPHAEVTRYSWAVGEETVLETESCAAELLLPAGEYVLGLTVTQGTLLVPDGQSTSTARDVVVEARNVDCSVRAIPDWQGEADGSRIFADIDLHENCQLGTEPLVFTTLRGLNAPWTWSRAQGATAVYGVDADSFSINLNAQTTLQSVRDQRWWLYVMTTGTRENSGDVCTGRSSTADWQDIDAEDSGRIYVDIDTSHCRWADGWEGDPVYITSLSSSSGGHQNAVGSSAIWPRPDGRPGFRVYITEPGLSARAASSSGWRLNWQGNPEGRNKFIGTAVDCTGSPPVVWRDAGENRVRGLIDRSQCGVEANSYYYLSLSGDTGHDSVTAGINALNAFTNEWFDVALVGPGLTAEIANANNYRINYRIRGRAQETTQAQALPSEDQPTYAACTPGGSECGEGESCVAGQDRFDDVTAGLVCLPAACVEDEQAAGCGTADSLCGACLGCVPSCAAADCMTVAEDGCGGQCDPVACQLGDECSESSDCVGGQCVDGSENHGMASGTRICVPHRCVTGAQLLEGDCGFEDSVCGLECPDCQGPDCDEPRECDGGCEANEACFGGECVALYAEDGGIDPPLPAPLPPATDTAAVGALAASVGASPSGLAAVSMGLTVPPGRKGMQPALSLNHTGARNPRGYVGRGWQLGGFSSISRCPDRLPYSAHHGPVRWDAEDAFCLDGVRLIPTTGPFGPVDAYRKAVDDNTLVLAHGVSPSSGPTYFTVYSPSGDIFTYGGTEDSRLMRRVPQTGVAYCEGDACRAVATLWGVSRRQDRYGNYVATSYYGANQAPSGEVGAGTRRLYPREIRYTGFEGNGVSLPPSRRVLFHYRHKPSGFQTASERARNAYVDRWQVGLPGALGTAAGADNLLLDSVVVDVPSEANASASAAIDPGLVNPLSPSEIETRRIARSYSLAYDEVSGVPQLRSVTECAGGNSIGGTGNTCKPPTVFSYNLPSDTVAAAGAPLPRLFDDPVNLGVSVDASFGNPTPQGRTGALASVGPTIVIDFNGDGADDVIKIADVAQSSTLSAKVYWGNPSSNTPPFVGTPGLYAFTEVSNITLGGWHDACFSQSSVVDLDRDGRQELLGLCPIEPGREAGDPVVQGQSQFEFRVLRFAGNSRVRFSDASTSSATSANPLVEETVFTIDNVNVENWLAWPFVPFLADVNGDGYRDLLRCDVGELEPLSSTGIDDVPEGPPDTGELYIYLNDRQGSFRGGVGDEAALITVDYEGACPRALTRNLVARHGISGNYRANPPIMVDLDGDGVTEVLFTENPSHPGIGVRALRVELVNGAYAARWEPVGFETQSSWQTSRYGPTTEMKVIDFNGDGLSDILYQVGAGTVEVAINLGTGSFSVRGGVQAWLPSGEPVPSLASENPVLAMPSFAFKHAVVIDYDQDGRQDLLVPRLEYPNVVQPAGEFGRCGALDAFFSICDADDASSVTWQLLRTNTRGFTVEPVSGLPTDVMSLFGGPKIVRHPVQGDFDGDGDRDLLFASSRYPFIADSTWDPNAWRQGEGAVGLRLVKNRSSQRHLLTSVTDGLGNRSTLTYSADTYARDGQCLLTSLSTPACGNNTAAGEVCRPSPDQARGCLSRRGPMVEQVARFSPGTAAEGGTLAGEVTAYRYFNRRRGDFGRILGFEKREAITTLNGALRRTVTSEYETTRGSDETQLPAHPFAGRLLRQTVAYPGTSEFGLGTSTSRVVTQERDWDINPENAASIVLGFERQLTEEALAGAPEPLLISRVESTFEHDRWSNVTSKVMTTFNWPEQGLLEVETQTTRNTTRALDEATRLVRWVDRTEVTSERGGDVKTRVVTFEPLAGTQDPAVTIRQPGDPSLEHQTALVRDDYGNVIESTVTTPDDFRMSLTEYGDANVIYPTSVTNAAGHRTDVRYDDVHGEVAASRGANGELVERQFDVFGRLRLERTPFGETTHAISSVDPTTVSVASASVPAAVRNINVRAAFAVRSQDVSGEETFQVFDSLGRAVQTGETSYDALQSAGQAQWLWSESEYDGAGRLGVSSRSHTLGASDQGSVEYTYDALDRPSLVTSLGQGASGLQAEVQRLQYAPAELVASIPSALFGAEAVLRTDARGVQSMTIYDPMGNPVLEVEGDDPANVSSSGAILTRKSYAAFSDLSSVVYPDLNYTVYQHDDWGRLIEENDPDRGLTAFSYFNTDEVRTETRFGESGSRAKGFRYDSLGRVTDELLRQTVGSVPGPDIRVAGYLYDQGVRALGKLSYSESFDDDGTPVSSTTLEYEDDEQGLLLTSLKSVSGINGAESSEYVTEFTYDNYGRVESVAYPELAGLSGAERFVVQHQRDTRGNVVALNGGAAATPVPMWRLTALEASSLYVTGERIGESVERSTAYDPRSGRLMRVSSTNADGAAVQDLSYTYYASGLVQTRVDPLAVGARSTQSYEYNSLNQLRGVTGTTGAALHTYSYNPAGNIIASMDRGTVLYNHPSRPHAVTSSNGGHSYEYDEFGNQSLRLGPSIAQGRQELTYNHLDLPRTIVTGEAAAAQRKTTRFRYDASGMRVRRDDTSAAGDTSVITPNELVEVIQTDTETRVKFKVWLGEEQIAEVEALSTGPATSPELTTTYLHRDHLGSTTVLTDESGGVLERIAYTPFGLPIGGSSFSELRSRFTGHDYDQDLGLVNMKGRIFDPSLARFLSPDPFTEQPLRAQSGNKYAYVLNNPVNLVDPTGYCGQKRGGRCSGTVYDVYQNGEYVGTIDGSNSEVTFEVNGVEYTVRQTETGFQRGHWDVGADGMQQGHVHALDPINSGSVSPGMTGIAVGSAGPLGSGQGAIAAAGGLFVSFGKGLLVDELRTIDCATGGGGCGGRKQAAAILAVGVGIIPVGRIIKVAKVAAKFIKAKKAAKAARGGGRMSAAAAKEFGILREAAQGAGNFGLGSAYRATAQKLGRVWVGAGAKLASDGKTLVSANGLRQFRPPSFKPRLGKYQANFEQRAVPNGPWKSNGHLDILQGPVAP